MNWLDVAVAAGLCALGLYEVLGAPIADDVVTGPQSLNVATVALVTLPLAWRRRAPLAVAVIVFAAFGLRPLLDSPLEIYSPILACVIATYSVGSYGDLRALAITAVVAVAAVLVAGERGTGGDASPDPVPALTLLATVGLIGRVVNVRHAAAADVEQRAAHREREAKLAVEAERARLARELHDAVSHSLASIVMQAGGAQDTLDTAPARARESLAAIERAAREGLTEMRRLLGLLGTSGAPLTPQPGLEALDTLLADARDAGLSVQATVEGERRPLPPAVDLSAYRIVQEALTNVMKHAGPCTATVRVRYGRDVLDVEVSDDGTSPQNGRGAGHGLPGMRARVDVLGGAFDAGPREDGQGFHVRATLPLPS